MASIPDDHPFDIREQLARIDKMRAETLKIQEEQQKVIVETLKAQREAAKVAQDTKFAPWTIVVTVLGAGAALFAAGGAFVKLLIG